VPAEKMPTTLATKSAASSTRITIRITASMAGRYSVARRPRRTSVRPDHPATVGLTDGPRGGRLRG
jgi:hypothetical protein